MIAQTALLRSSLSRGSLCALLCLLVSSCFSTPPKDEHFYFINGPTSEVKTGSGPRIGVVTFTAAPGYDSQRLAYREGENHLRYYGYRQWVAEPPQMLTEVVIRHLRASGRFAEVGPSDKVHDPDLLLSAHVVAIEEVDQAKNSWNARLAMTFELRDEQSQRVRWRHTFDRTRPCARRDPEDVARILSKLLAGEMEQVSRAISKIKPAAE